jgi:nucleotide-binding universal stress UspA family protein
VVPRSAAYRSVPTISSGESTPTIVVGYDGSDPARAALVFAARQAGTRGRVFVVHAYELPPDFLGSPYYDHFLSERRDRGEALLRDLPLQDAWLTGPEYEMELIGGSAAEAITDVARARHADQIVVGARGLGRIRALLGSVSHELLHIADRPVVVIPAAALRPEE